MTNGVSHVGVSHAYYGKHKAAAENIAETCTFVSHELVHRSTRISYQIKIVFQSKYHFENLYMKINSSLVWRTRVEILPCLCTHLQALLTLCTRPVSHCNVIMSMRLCVQQFSAFLCPWTCKPRVPWTRNKGIHSGDRFCAVGGGWRGLQGQ